VAWPARSGSPSDTQFTSEDDRLSAFRYFQQNPDSEYANAARRPLARIERYVQNSGVGRAYNHLFDGTFGSNEADIQDQYDRESRAAGFFGGIGAFGRAQGREIGNLFNLYTPQPVREDNRPVDADTALRNAEATAQTLGQFGDRSLSDYQATSATLRRLQDPSTLGTFVGAYGTVEGTARYGNALSRLRGQQIIDQTPGGADLDEARQQGYLLSQPESQRGELQALIRFMSQNNVGNPRALYAGASPITLNEALNTDGTSGGPGFLTQDDSKRFLAVYRQQAANAAEQVLQEIDKQTGGAQRVLSATSGAGLDESDIAGARFGASVENSYLALSPLERGGLSLDQYRQRRLTGAVTSDLQGAVDQRGRAAQALGASQLREGAAEFGGGDGSIERSIDLQKQYADALGRAAEKGPEAVAALNKLIDGIAKLEEQASHTDFDAKNYSAAYSSNQSTAWDNYVASQPVAARAGLQAIGPIVNQPGFNPILAQHNPLSQSDTAEITRQATQLGLPNDLTGYALTIPRLEGATDHPELPLTRQFGLTGQYATQVNPNSRSSAIGAMLSALRDNYARTGSAPGAALAYNTGPDDPGLPAFIATGDTSHLASPAGARYAAGLGFASPQDRLAAGYADPAVNANIQATLARQRAGYGLSIADLQAGSYGRTAIEPQVLQDIASGQTGAQRVLEAGVNQNPGSPVGAAEATQRAAEAQRTLTEQITSSQAATRQQTQDSQQMASAILQGGDAAARATAAIAAHKEALATNSTVAEENKQAQLNLAAALAQEQQSAATAQHAVQQGTQRSQFLTGLPITDDYDRQYQIGQYDYEKQQQQANPLSYAANPTGFNAQADQNFAAIQSTNDVAQSASAATTAFDNMGKAIFSSFETASYSTQRFKKTMGELLQSISQIILKLTVEQPLESLFTKTIGGWFGTSLNNVGNPNPSGGLFGALGLFGSSGGNGNSQNIVNPGLYSGIFDSSIGYGGVGGAAAAAAGGAASDAEGGAVSDLIFGAAAGGVWGPSGRINYHAAGGIFSGPTAFMDAGGGSNVAGEAGPEAAIPLTVLPDGSLGIKSGGGAGGPQILVHAPITYNAAGGGNGGGGVDQDNMKQIQKQFETMATEAVKNVLLRQQRPGGMLYNSYAGQSS
jgi:hypothetical protein